MNIYKTDFAVINRSFWPHNQVIGEALLTFAERLSESKTVCVITQTTLDLREAMEKDSRGENIKLCTCKAYTNSSSSILKRVLEVVFFMVWVFVSLLWQRPKEVYVSTDPPVLVPFVVFLYSKLFRAKYYYHLQDIHPEAANIIVPVNKLAFWLLKKLDGFTVERAERVITLSGEMRNYLIERSSRDIDIAVLENPALEVVLNKSDTREDDVVFCGNAGRLQRIPLLISSINKYLERGGKLRFTFIGAGIYSSAIEDLANKFSNVKYLGYQSAPIAADIVKNHRWALLPIDDEVTKYAFPSKSSSYVLSGCQILAICGLSTSVERWIEKNAVGRVCEPEEDTLVESFKSMENEVYEFISPAVELTERLRISYFVQQLMILCSVKDSECQSVIKY